MHNSHQIDLSSFSGLLYSEVDLLDKHSKWAYPNRCRLNSKHLSASISIVDAQVCSRSLLNCFLNRFLCAKK